MEKLNLSEHQFKKEKQRDMEVALAWNVIKNFLTSQEKEGLFSYIKSIRLTEKNIHIITEKPIVNQEILFLEISLLNNINQSMRQFGFPERTTIRMR